MGRGQDGAGVARGGGAAVTNTALPWRVLRRSKTFTVWPTATRHVTGTLLAGAYESRAEAVRAAEQAATTAARKARRHTVTRRGDTFTVEEVTA